MSIDKGPSPEPPPPGPSSPASELLADEVASVAVDDPERAAELVAAVAPDKPESSAPGSTGVKPSGLVGAATGDGGPLPAQALPGAVVAVLVLQLLVTSRLKRLVLAVVGSALVYALLDEQQRKRS